MDQRTIFNTAQEAYNYLFTKLLDKGEEIEVASEKAYKFSSEYAERMGIPQRGETPETGVKKWLSEIKVITDFLNNNPTVVEIGKPIIVGALSSIVGGVTGITVADSVSNTSSPIPNEPIIYDEDIPVNTNINQNKDDHGIQEDSSGS